MNINKEFLKISIKSDGYNFNITDFKPYMITNISSPNNKIYFVSNIPITMRDLINSKIFTPDKINPSDFIQKFTNEYYFNKFISYMKNKQKKIYKKEPNDNIIKNNINLILSILFNNNFNLKYNNRYYSIDYYDWDFTYDKSKSTYIINIILYILDQSFDKENNKKKTGCIIRLRKIYNQLGFKNKPLILKNVPDLTRKGGKKYNKIKFTRKKYYSK